MNPRPSNKNNSRFFPADFPRGGCGLPARLHGLSKVPPLWLNKNGVKERQMRNYLTKSLLAILCLTMMTVPLTAQKGKGGGSTDGSGCAVVATPLLSTVTASPGINVGIFSRVGNCSSGKKRYTVTISAVSSCGEETVIASPVVSFDGGQYKLISTTYAISPDTCHGLSTVSVSAYSGGTLLASESTTLTIQ
jgi:hypothetical protein